MRSILLVALALTACKKAGPAGPSGLEKPVALPSGVDSGTLENGVRWYRATEGEPSVTLAVAAGSAAESDDQRGAAFALARAFELTHDGGSARVGADRVSFTLPAGDSPEDALEALVDWACCASIPLDTDALIQSAAAQRDPFVDAVREDLFLGSALARRPVAPDDEALRALDSRAVEAFRKERFRSDHMAVVLTTRIGEKELDKALSRFSPASAPAELTRVPEQEGEMYAAVDGEPALHLYGKRDWPYASSQRWFREQLLGEVGLAIVRARFERRAAELDAPFAEPRIDRVRFSSGEGADHLVVTPGPDADRSWAAVWEEIERLHQHGVLNAEIRAAEARVGARWAELPEETDAQRIDELVLAGLFGRAYPGRDHAMALAELFVPTFTVAEITEWAGRFMGTRSRVGIAVGVEIDLAAVEGEVRGRPTEPPLNRSELERLVDPPEPGKIAKRTSLEPIGTERWTLSNGATVWVRPEDTGDIAIRIFRKGGLDGIDDRSFRSAALAPIIIAASGFEGLSPQEVTRFLAARRVALQPRLTDHTTALSGYAGSEDLGEALQLVRLYFTAARFVDDDAYLAARDRFELEQARRLEDPYATLLEGWNAMLYPRDPRRLPISSDEVVKMQPELAAEAWSQLYGDPGDFHFVFAGPVPPDFEALVQTWIASLPSAGKGKSRRDRGHRRATGALTADIVKGLEARSYVRMELWGPLPDGSWESRERLRVLADMVDLAVSEEFPSSTPSLYGIRVSSEDEAFPRAIGAVRVEFTSFPTKVEGFRDRLVGAIERFRQEAPDNWMLEQVQARAVERWESRSNVTWADELQYAVERGLDPEEIPGRPERMAELTLDDLQVLKDWVHSDRIVLATLDAEEGAVKEPPDLTPYKDELVGASDEEASPQPDE